MENEYRLSMVQNTKSEISAGFWLESHSEHLKMSGVTFVP